jgi:hypothetical protein
VGYVSDLYGGRRACVIVSFLGLLCPLLYVFSQYSDIVRAAAAAAAAAACELCVESAG